MAVEVRMPRIGQSMSEGTVTGWLREPGSAVAAGEAVVAVETDKTEFEVEAPETGRLGKPRVAVGETVPVGTLLVEILAPGEEEAASPVGAAATAPAPAVPRPTSPAARGEARARASPKARRLAQELSVDLAMLTGTGPEGLITHRDVERAIAPRVGRPQVAPPAPFAGRAVRERRPLTSVARATARHTQTAWQQAPHFVQMIDVDMTAAKEARAVWQAAGDPRAATTLGDLFVAATARALCEHPALNAGYEGDALLLFDGVHIGVAVDTPRGLLVPVVRHADQLDLAALSTRIRELAQGARDGQLSPDLLEGGSATVSNLGAYGIRMGTPVLHSPEALLVFVGVVEDRVVVHDGAPAVRAETTLSIAYDHRVVDGARASEFTRRLRDLLEAPQNWLELRAEWP